MESIARTIKALSDPGRLRILNMLEVKPLCVCEITAVLGLAVSTVSKHLSILKGAGFICDRKEQKWVEYRLASDFKNQMEHDLLALVLKEFRQKSACLSEKKMAAKVDRNLLCGPAKK